MTGTYQYTGPPHPWTSSRPEGGLEGSASLTNVIMDSKLLYASAEIITPLITKLFNVCMHTQTVIDDWKFAKVTPIFKGKGCKNDKNNCQPISVISHIAKIFEKEIQSQLMTYLIQHDFISLDQSAYRKFHNTQTSLHRVVDDWLDNMSDDLVTGVCLLDIKKCFDSIDHDILINKLDFYGIRNSECMFFSVLSFK